MLVSRPNDQSRITYSNRTYSTQETELLNPDLSIVSILPSKSSQQVYLRQPNLWRTCPGQCSCGTSEKKKHCTRQEFALFHLAGIADVEGATRDLPRKAGSLWSHGWRHRKRDGSPGNPARVYLCPRVYSPFYSPEIHGEKGGADTGSDLRERCYPF